MPDRPRIALIGMGASAATLTAEALEALRRARRVAGARRLLEALPPDVTRDRVPAVRAGEIWQAVRDVDRAAVLYSGDTGFYSGAAELLELLRGQEREAEVFPGLSSVQMLAARLGRPWQDWKLVSAHGRACDPVAAVCGGKPAFFLTGVGESGPAALCQKLTDAGLGGLSVAVGEDLGLASQKIFSGSAAQAAGAQFGPLAVLLAEPAFRLPARTPGWPDGTFVRAEGVPMTKQAVRAQVLAQLAVRPGETVWDVGAGTGSVSVELAYANGGAPVCAVECLPAACAVLEENRRRLGGWNIRVTAGTAPEALQGLPAPDAVLIGGTRGRLEPILDAVLAANPAARVCLTAIALETLAAALAAFGARGMEPEVTQIAAAHAGGPGRLHLLRAENPVFILTAAKEKV